MMASQHQIMQVQVPPGSGPGQQIQVHAGGQLVAVTVPEGVTAGKTFQMQVLRTRVLECRTGGDMHAHAVKEKR